MQTDTIVCVKTGPRGGQCIVYFIWPQSLHSLSDSGSYSSTVLISLNIRICRVKWDEGRRRKRRDDWIEKHLMWQTVESRMRWAGIIRRLWTTVEKFVQSQRGWQTKTDAQMGRQLENISGEGWPKEPWICDISCHERGAREDLTREARGGRRTFEVTHDRLKERRK